MFDVSNRPKVLIVGAGGCGCNNLRKLLETIQPTIYPTLRVRAINTDHALIDEQFDGDNPVIAPWFESRQLEILKLSTGKNKKGHGAGFNPDVGLAALQPHLEQIQRAVETVDIVILEGGFGKGTGNSVIPALGKLLKEDWHKPALAAVTMPFMGEGGKFVSRAREAKKEILDTTPTILISNQSLIKILKEKNQDMEVDEAYRLINNACFVPMLMVLLEIITRVGLVRNMDLNDVLSVLQTGNYLFFGFAKLLEQFSVATGREQATGLVEELTHSQFQNARIIQNATRAFMWTRVVGGGVGLEAEQAIMNGVKSKMLNQGQGADFPSGMRKAPVEEGEAESILGSRWIGILTAANEPPPSEEGEEPAEQETPKKGNGKVFPMIAPQVPFAAKPVEASIAPKSKSALLVCWPDGSKREVTITADIVHSWNVVNQSSGPNKEQVEHLLKCIARETDGGKPVNISDVIRTRLWPNQQEEAKASTRGFMRFSRRDTSVSVTGVERKVMPAD